MYQQGNDERMRGGMFLTELTNIVWVWNFQAKLFCFWLLGGCTTSTLIPDTGQTSPGIFWLQRSTCRSRFMNNVTFLTRALPFLDSKLCCFWSLGVPPTLNSQSNLTQYFIRAEIYLEAKFHEQCYIFRRVRAL